MNQNHSDNEIMLNFIDCVKKIYPNLIFGDCYCYDSWDQIIEPLYFQLVMNTYSWKYSNEGADKSNCHQYETRLNHLDRIHVICKPINKSTLVFNCMGECIKVHSDDYEFIFNSISDGQHVLTGSFEKEEALKVRFDMVQVQMVDKKTGDMEDCEYQFIHLNDLEFESSYSKKTVI